MKKQIIIVSLLGILVCFLSACASRHAPAAQKPTHGVQYFSHTVRFPGETLGVISEWYTGDLKNWEKILAANPTLQVNKIQIGQVILLPGELVKKHTTIPEELVNRRAAQLKAKRMADAPAKVRVEVTPTATADSSIATTETKSVPPSVPVTAAPVATTSATDLGMNDDVDAILKSIAAATPTVAAVASATAVATSTREVVPATPTVVVVVPTPVISATAVAVTATVVVETPAAAPIKTREELLKELLSDY